MLRIFTFLFTGIALLVPMSLVLAADKPRDRHVGYYYPKPQIREAHVSKMPVAPSATPRSRAAFAVGVALQQSRRQFAPPYHLFVKGATKEKLIIIATETGRYSTGYRLRALLAAMTSEARGTELFNRAPNPENLTFLDFCKLMGFRRVTISDGDRVAIQIDIK